MFFLNGERFAYRTWDLIPRVGDEVMFEQKGKKVAFKVKRVVWGVEGPEEERFNRQAVNIEIEPA